MLRVFLHSKIYFGNGRKKVLTTGEERSKIGDVCGKEAASGPKKHGKTKAKKTSKKVKKGVDKANELRYTNEAVPQKGERKHLENYIVHQQTSQVNSDLKIEKKRTLKETRPSEKSEQNAERR